MKKEVDVKLVCILGSPNQKGSSANIADRLCRTAGAKDASVKSYYLNKLKYVGCQSCMACKSRSEICVIRDDLTQILADVREADIVVLASPVYFGDLTAQMKGFIDRTYSFLTQDYKSRLSPGKRLVMILPQGDPDPEHFADIFKRYDEFFKWYGFKKSFLIRAFYDMKSKVTPLEDAYRQADEIAAKLMK